MGKENENGLGYIGKNVECLKDFDPYQRYHAHSDYRVTSIWDEENDEYTPLVERIEGCAHSELFGKGQINIYLGSIYASFTEDEFVEKSFTEYLSQIITHELIHLIPEMNDDGDAHHHVIDSIEEHLEWE